VATAVSLTEGTNLKSSVAGIICTREVRVRPVLVAGSTERLLTVTAYHGRTTLGLHFDGE
jgi:hypothetical protein